MNAFHLSSLSLLQVAVFMTFCSGVLAEPVTALKADPAVLVFTSPDQRATVALTQGGAPVAAAAIQGYDFLVEKHTYEYMVSMEKRDGAVVIAPTAQAEVGSYDLVIRTAQGAVTVQVYMPLSDLEGIVEEQAKALGITVEEVKERLGIARRYGQETIHFESPLVVYAGQELVVATPCPPGRSYEWRLDGSLLAQGGEAAPLRHRFDTPGVHALEYRETADGRPVASGVAAVTVVMRPTAGKLE